MQHAGPSSPPPKAEQQAAAAAAASARTRAAGQRGFAGYTPSTHHSLADAHDAAWERDSGAAAPQPPAPAPAAEAGRAEDEAEADAQAAAGAAERNPQEEQDWMTQMVREPEGAPAQDDDGRAAAEEQLQLQRRLEEDAATSAAADAQNAGLEFPSTSSDAMAAVMRLAQAASSYDAADAGAAAERAGEWPSAEQEGMAAGDGTQGEGEQSNKRPLSTSKRAAQNRAAQRAFRERRDKRVKELELRDQLLQPTQEYAAELRLRLAETNSYAHQLREMLLARGVAEEEVPSPPTYPELQAPPLDITEGEAAGSPTGGEAGPSKKRRKSGKTKSPQMQPEYAHHPDDASMLDLAAAATAPHAQHETDGLEWLEQHHPQAHGHMQHQGAGNEEALDSLSAVAVEAAAAAAHAAAHEHAAQDEAQARAEMLEHEAQHGQGEQEMQEPPQLEEPAEHLLEQHAEDDEAAAAQAAGMAAA